MMTVRTAVLGAVAMVWLAGASFADDHSALLSRIQDAVLDMHIEARVISDNETEPEDQPAQTVLWDASMIRQTMMGRSVTIRLHGTNVLVRVRFTPYISNDRELMLICQSEIWVQAPEGTGVSYRTSIEALAVDLGEPVYLFPLGAGARADVIAAVQQHRSSTAEESNDDGAALDPENDYNLVLEILVVPASTEGRASEDE